MSKRYELVNYFDVWGNEEEGYEVNDSCIEDNLEIADDMSDSDIVDLLCELGYLTTTDGVIASNTGDGWEIETENGMPLYGLRPEM